VDGGGTPSRPRGSSKKPIDQSPTQAALVQEALLSGSTLAFVCGGGCAKAKPIPEFEPRLDGAAGEAYGKAMRALSGPATSGVWRRALRDVTSLRLCACRTCSEAKLRRGAARAGTVVPANQDQWGPLGGVVELKYDGHDFKINWGDRATWDYVSENQHRLFYHCTRLRSGEPVSHRLRLVERLAFNDQFCCARPGCGAKPGDRARSLDGEELYFQIRVIHYEFDGIRREHALLKRGGFSNGATTARELASGWGKFLCGHCHRERTWGRWDEDELAAYLDEVEVFVGAEEEEAA